MKFSDVEIGEKFRFHQDDIGGEYVWEKINKDFAKVVVAPDIAPLSLGLKLSFNKDSIVFHLKGEGDECD